MKNHRLLIKATSIYQLCMGLISLFYILVAIIQNPFDNYLVIVGFLAFCSIVVVTVINNIQILVHLDRLKPLYFSVNAIICIIQVLHIFTNGFYFKYVQGLGLVGYIAVVHSSKEVSYGAFLTNLIWEFTIKFDKSDGTLIGVNFIAFVLLIYYYWLSKNIGNNRYLESG